MLTAGLVMIRVRDLVGQVTMRHEVQQVLGRFEGARHEQEDEHQRNQCLEPTHVLYFYITTELLVKLTICPITPLFGRVRCHEPQPRLPIPILENRDNRALSGKCPGKKGWTMTTSPG